MLKKICIIGANGGIGGYVAAHLAKALNAGDAEGWELNGLLHSQESLSKMTANGLSFYDHNPLKDGHHNHINEKFFVSNDPHKIGRADVIICATPADKMPLDAISTMTKPENTIVVPMLNGLPFWYPELHDVSKSALASIDPDDKILMQVKELGVHLVGSIVDVAAIKKGPGLVEGHPAINDEGEFVHGQMHFGAVNEDSDVAHSSCQDLVALFEACNIPVNHLKNKSSLVRQVWVKLAGNASANYGATLEDQALPELYADLSHGEFYKEAIAETLRVGLKHGLSEKFERLIPKVVDAIVSAKSELKGHRTSTHASYESGVEDCEHSVIIAPVKALAKESGTVIPNVLKISENFQSALTNRNRFLRTGLSNVEAAVQARRLVMNN